VTSWVPAVSVPPRSVSVPPRSAALLLRETQRPTAPPQQAGDAKTSIAPGAAAELTASLQRVRQRFRDVSAVVQGLGGLRTLGGEDALIEMAMFAQSHEHTLERAWAALDDCEQLVRLLIQPAVVLRDAEPPSSAPPATERAPAAGETQAAAPPVEAPEGDDDEGNVTQVDIAPARVLVVDDDPTVLRAFRRVLAGDHEVLTARDGAEALRLVLGGERVDAIICDISMPKLDGPAFFSELFELRPQMMPRVVFCTGGQPNERTQRFLAQLQAPLLYKPVAVEELRRAIEAVRSR
jgi:CheY-like chemotaxis protein